jgi:hypothetical protein
LTGTAAPEKRAGGKYGVSAVEDRTAGGLKFDSKLEMNAHQFLVSRKIPFERQKVYELQPELDIDGQHLRPIRYKADFFIPHSSGDLVIDMKGVRTEVFRLKQKWLLGQHKVAVICLKSVNELAALLHKKGML